MRSISIFDQGGDNVNDLEILLQDNYYALERFVKFKINNRFHAADIIQDVCLTATVKFGTLKNRSSFKSWLIGIASHKCNDYYRLKAKEMNISLELLPESSLVKGVCGINERNIVQDTLDALGDKEKQILYLYFLKNMSQEEISIKLNIPIGTVKSRLHYAKEKFKHHYHNNNILKGENIMKNLPEVLFDYKIERSEKAPFRVRWEEIMGWFIVPKLNEKIKWAMYEHPSKNRTELCDMKVVGKASVHGIEGVEIVSIETDPMECNSAGGKKRVERHFVAQLTETHCRLLAESHEENGIKKFFTFLDGEDFLGNWGFGEDNCGNEIEILPKGDIVREGNDITSIEKEFLLDVVGRYNVTINGKTFDTICVIDCYTYIDGAMTEQFIDKNGKTVLWRRFNRNDWAYKRYGKLWTEMLPNNETMSVNGQTYVHWYDCITDYIL